MKRNSLLLILLLISNLFAENNLSNEKIEKYKKVFIINEYHDFIKELPKFKKSKSKQFKLYKSFYFFDNYNNIKKSFIDKKMRFTEKSDNKLGKQVCIDDYIFNENTETCLLFSNFPLMKQDNYKLVSVILSFDNNVTKKDLKENFSYNFFKKKFLPFVEIFNLKTKKMFSNNVFNYEGNLTNKIEKLSMEKDKIFNKIKEDFVYSTIFYETDINTDISAYDTIDDFSISKLYNRKIQYTINFYKDTTPKTFLIFSGNDYYIHLSSEFGKIIDVNPNEMKKVEELFLENNI